MPYLRSFYLVCRGAGDATGRLSIIAVGSQSASLPGALPGKLNVIGARTSFQQMEHAEAPDAARIQNSV